MPAPEPEPAPEVAPAPAAETIEQVMDAHFLITAWARDVVIAGQVDPLREVMLAVSELHHDTLKRPDWKPWIGKLQAAARRTSVAKNLRSAAKGVSAMAQVCGDCHRASGQGPKFAPEGANVFLPYPETFDERMDRHMWAAEELWFGLIGPSDASWRAGAAALRDAPKHMTDWLSDDFSTALARVREVGTRAGEATSPSARADVYAEVLTTCASCHTRWLQFGR